ncbi:MAG: DedA family protein [Ignavibacteriales bacterium]
MDTIEFWIHHYGYGGIYVLLMLGIVGIPVPDETLLALSGFLAYKGELKLIPVVLSAFAGSISGITISYFIGRGFGKIVLEKYGHFFHLTSERLDKAHEWFARIGRWALVLGYFIPGVRHVIAILAGSTRLKLSEFMLYTYTGGFIWTATFISIGYFFGEKWKNILNAIHHHIIISSAVLLLIVVLVIAYRIYSVKRGNARAQKSDVTLKR